MLFFERFLTNVKTFIYRLLKFNSQGNVFNCVKQIFLKPGLIERYIPLIQNEKKIRCPNSLGSEKMGVEVVYVKTFTLL